MDASQVNSFASLLGGVGAVAAVALTIFHKQWVKARSISIKRQLLSIALILTATACYVLGSIVGGLYQDQGLQLGFMAFGALLFSADYVLGEGPPTRIETLLIIGLWAMLAVMAQMYVLEVTIFRPLASLNSPH